MAVAVFEVPTKLFSAEGAVEAALAEEAEAATDCSVDGCRGDSETLSPVRLSKKA